MLTDLTYINFTFVCTAGTTLYLNCQDCLVIVSVDRLAYNQDGYFKVDILYAL